MNRNFNHQPRVFCVGWHKTGTSTLGIALLELGYSVLGARLDLYKQLQAGDIQSVLDVAAEFDALQDVPWAALYQELDERYPGSRFILIERDAESWLKSAKRHFSDTYVPLHEWLYGEGVLEGNEHIYIERYKKHNEEVKEYFSERPEDLLVMNLHEGDGWEKICKFLKCDVPNKRFPHSNKGPHSYTIFDKIINKIRKLVPLRIRAFIFKVKLKLLEFRGRPDPRNKFNNMVENRTERENRLRK